ncbi:MULTISPECIES: Imm50 family immunity protein [Enterobacteriaceae]|jgi:hypothetical protein|uniref:Imm50 family immunity protein n=1 Tax=Enterobacteriaceae TaxID=543 RepID=UPI0011A2B2AB|nr:MULTISPECIES: Imm50 family immunity protein [Enterobacteriaceae]
MWFDNALGKEKIEFMFGGELSLQSVEVSSFSFERFSDVTFQFYSRNIPSSYPEKWSKSKFNALSVVITFGGIIELDVKGNGIGFICSPEISSSESHSEIKICSNQLYINCKSKFLTIESITPYLDERWD